jgi:hypothetical protein
LRQSQKTLLFWALLILMVIAIWNMFAPSKAQDDKVAFGQLMQEVQNNPERIKKP